MRKLILTIGILMMMLNVIAQTIPTRDEFFKVCDSLEIHHPYVVWAQARHESGNFTSDNYRHKNNCLGIYDSKNKRYDSFGSWQECLSAYKDRFQYRCTNITCSDEAYLSELVQRGYAADKNYYARIIRIVNQEKKR